MDPRSPAAVPGGGKLRLERHCQGMSRTPCLVTTPEQHSRHR